MEGVVSWTKSRRRERRDNEDRKNKEQLVDLPEDRCIAERIPKSLNGDLSEHNPTNKKKKFSSQAPATKKRKLIRKLFFKLLMFNTIFVPIMLHARETWILIEMKILKKIAKKTKQLQCYGRILKVRPDKLIKKSFEARLFKKKKTKKNLDDRRSG